MMKCTIPFLILLLGMSFAAKSQYIVGWQTVPNPPNVGQNMEIIASVAFANSGGSSNPYKCEDMHGFRLYSNSYLQILDVYYLRKAPFTYQCLQTDTFSLGILDSKITKIAINTFTVSTNSQGQPDTSAIFSTYTINLAQIGLPQYGVAKGFEVYPNPAKDKITINAPQPGPLENLVLLDLSGRKVLSVAHFDPQEILHLRNLPAGIYFLQFEQSGAVFREKLLIQ